MLAGGESFSSKHLLEYVESLLRKSRFQERRTEQQSNYSWLKSKNLQDEFSIDNNLGQLRPMIQKMTSENCVALAVKLENFTEETTSTNDILITFKKLLEEQYSIQLMAGNVKRVNKTTSTRNMNKVHPVLSPSGRHATVSFILHEGNTFYKDLRNPFK